MDKFLFPGACGETRLVFSPMNKRIFSHIQGLKNAEKLKKSGNKINAAEVFQSFVVLKEIDIIKNLAKFHKIVFTDRTNTNVQFTELEASDNDFYTITVDPDILVFKIPSENFLYEYYNMTQRVTSKYKKDFPGHPKTITHEIMTIAEKNEGDLLIMTWENSKALSSSNHDLGANATFIT